MRVKKGKKAKYGQNEEEKNTKKPYEIPGCKSYIHLINSMSKPDIVCEICELIKSKEMSYREANEALYNADKVLREIAITKSF